MKLVKNFVLATLLVSTLAINTFAGDIDIPGYAPPPPPRLSVETEEPVITGTDTQEPGAGTDNLLYEALAALLSLY